MGVIRLEMVDNLRVGSIGITLDSGIVIVVVRVNRLSIEKLDEVEVVVEMTSITRTMIRIDLDLDVRSKSGCLTYHTDLDVNDFVSSIVDDRGC